MTIEKWFKTGEGINWDSVHAAEGDMVCAIKRLIKQKFNFEEILGYFAIALYKEFKEAENC